jgi:GNAT superfamily N-acetyltransferase
VDVAFDEVDAVVVVDGDLGAGDAAVDALGLQGALAGAPAEIKRMWIAPAARGLGLGRRLLAELAACAVAGGAHSVRLETNAVLTEALALYRSAGWVEVLAFNDEPFADHWFEKALG